MNPMQLERLLLLEQSGELAPKQRRELEAELAGSAEARQQRDDLRRLAAALPAPAAQPVPGTATKIAARLRQPARPAFNLLPAWKPALAAAAALALILGVRAYRAAPGTAEPAPAVAAAAAAEEEWTDPLETEFIALEELLAALDETDSFAITEL